MLFAIVRRLQEFQQTSGVHIDFFHFLMKYLAELENVKRTEGFIIEKIYLSTVYDEIYLFQSYGSNDNMDKGKVVHKLPKMSK